MKSFWQGLARPFFVLAPMADVTDPAFRALVVRHGKPDVLWTEFVSADGLYHTREILKMPDAENPLMRDLQFSAAEHPIVAQIFGSNPETIRYVAALVRERGFDGVDLNMGCPDRAIEKQKSGAACIKNPSLAREIIRAAKEGAGHETGGIPISVKTRIGYGKEVIDEWIPELLAETPAALTVHLRTRKEMSLVPAHWELMPRVVALRDAAGVDTRILGNGDVKDLADAREKAQTFGCDGVMIGRGIFGNPWLFAGGTAQSIPLSEKLDALVELAHTFETLRPQKSFHILKKHIKAFVTGFDGAAEFRAKLMETETAAALAEVIKKEGRPE